MCVRKRYTSRKGKDMTYRIIKVDSTTEQEQNFGGGYTKEDVQQVVKGYSFNGVFYSRKGSKYFFIVEED